jgi:hypothetical protein
VVAKAPQLAEHLGGSTLSARLLDGRAALFVGHAVVQDLPHQSTEPMGDRADRRRVAETDYASPVKEFEGSPSSSPRRWPLD